MRFAPLQNRSSRSSAPSPRGGVDIMVSNAGIIRCADAPAFDEAD